MAVWPCRWGSSESWDTVRHDRDGYFLELPAEEAAAINGVGAEADEDDGLEPELYGGEPGPRSARKLANQTTLRPASPLRDHAGRGRAALLAGGAAAHAATKRLGLRRPRHCETRAFQCRDSACLARLTTKAGLPVHRQRHGENGAPKARICHANSDSFMHGSRDIS